MVAAVVVSRFAPRRGPAAAAPSTLLRRGFVGAQSCAHSLLMHGVSPSSGRTYPTALATHAAVTEALREALAVVIRHPTLETLRDAFAAADAVRVAGKRATRSVAGVRSLHLPQWSLGMAGLLAALEDIEDGLESIALLPASAPGYPDED